MRTNIFSFLLATLIPGCASGAIIPDLEITGLPVNEDEVRATLDAVRALQYPNDSITKTFPRRIEFVSDFIPCEAESGLCFGVTQLRFGIWHTKVFLQFQCLEKTALAHELIHTRYGDENHTRKELWVDAVRDIHLALEPRFCPAP